MVSDRVDKAALGKSLMVHALVVGMFFFSWKSSEEVIMPKAMPMHVTAMIMEKPQKQTSPKPQPKPVPPKPEPKPEPKKPEPKPEPKKPEPKPEPKKPEPKKPEPKKPEPKKPEPKKPEPKKPEPKKPQPKKPEPTTDFSDLLKSEMKQLEKQKPKSEQAKTAKPAAAPPSSASSDDAPDEIQQYLAGIMQSVASNWSRPPSSRTGMVVTLRITMLPGGEVNDVNVYESSGNAAFDNAAVKAVLKAGRFVVPNDPVKFDRYFRALKLKFAPDDLMY